ncbi:HIPL1 protein [Striga hermonthica]|uniref:HIPL1 protein n=1 Tax=Striga hermonthica TaxID=68872 RepID=A0A9N7NDG3_STRHE|nr:HIPL1 protein [Striga hermonthica]
MRGNHFIWIIHSLILLQFLDFCFSLPLCSDSTAPFTPRSPLQFCPYNGFVCCNNTDDFHLRNQFLSMNISDPNCASLVRSILCSRCDQFSAELFRVDSAPRQLPVLCNSSNPTNSTQSNQNTNSFCSQVWNTCHNISISYSPFAPTLRTPASSNSSTLSDTWRTQEEFCAAFGGSPNDTSPCFSGSPIVLNNTTDNPTPPGDLCLEKIGNGSYLNMVGHADGSNRAFFSNQQGKIWLATIPEPGSGGVLGIDESNPFLDLSDEVHFDTQFGMMGIALHPQFVQNGRFFVSFNCDKAKWPGCAGRCACNSDVGCDPARLGPDNGAQPCQYQSVVAEYTVNGSSSRPSSATSANPLEVRRIFTIGLPFTAHHGGQILFGPEDGYLYFMMGDGGGVGDPYNFAQNKKSLLGKIMRFDVDNLPSDTEAARLGLWGNYSIPNDNPYTIDKDLQREIWALGLRNPWRCSFDSARPSYFICADTGQDGYEEVDLITKNGNYGWRAFEGPYPYTPPQTPGGNTSISSIRPIFPVMGYNHSEVNSNEGSASITGGYFYRSMADPCMHGRYLYADLYAGAIWAGTETPTNSGRFNSTQISFNCAHDSPIRCTFTPGSTLPSLSYIFSFGEDNNRDVYLLTNSGVYRIVRPSRCNYTCSSENASTVSQGPSASPPRSGAGSREILIFLNSFLCLVVMMIFM